MKSKKTGFKLATFTFIGFLALFIMTTVIGIVLFGWDDVFEEIIKYLIGASAFGMALSIVIFFMRKHIWKR